MDADNVEPLGANVLDQWKVAESGPSRLQRSAEALILWSQAAMLPPPGSMAA
jgi:hypothetical protein